MEEKKGLQPVQTTRAEDGTIKVWYRIADLILDENNARAHGDQDLDALAASLHQFGQQKPIVIDSDGVVRAGNGTCLALTRLGVALVWGVQSNLRGAEAVAYALADNRTAELSQWDRKILAESLVWLETQKQDITKLGWEDWEIAAMLREAKPAEPRERIRSRSAGPADSLVEIKVTPDQYDVIKLAVEKIRFVEEDPEISFGRALELICADWTS